MKSYAFGIEEIEGTTIKDTTFQEVEFSYRIVKVFLRVSPRSWLILLKSDLLLLSYLEFLDLPIFSLGEGISCECSS